MIISTQSDISMKKPFILCLIILSALFAACNEEIGGTGTTPASSDTISIYPYRALYFTKEADTDTLTVHSSDTWTVGETPNWLTASPMCGNNGDRLTISVMANDTAPSRRATLTLHCGDFYLPINIFQQHGDLPPETTPDTVSEPTPGKIAASERVLITPEHPYTFEMEDQQPGNWESFVLFPSQNRTYWQKYLFTTNASSFTVYPDGSRINWNSAVATMDSTNGHYYHEGMVVCRKDTVYFQFDVLPTQPIVESFTFMYDYFDYESGTFINPWCELLFKAERCESLYYYIAGYGSTVDTQFMTPTPIGNNTYSVIFEQPNYYWDHNAHIFMKAFNNFGTSPALYLYMTDYVDDPKVLEYISRLSPHTNP